jgi:hypothetical protein
MARQGHGNATGNHRGDAMAISLKSMSRMAGLLISLTTLMAEEVGPLRGLLIRSPDFTQMLFIESTGNVIQSYFRGYGKEFFRSGDDIHCAYLINLDKGVVVSQSETNSGKSLRIQRNGDVFPVSGLTQATFKTGNIEMCLFFVKDITILPSSAIEAEGMNVERLLGLKDKGQVDMQDAVEFPAH